MAFVICFPCVGEKNGACVSVCPSDAIHPKPGEPNRGTVPQLYINPAVCSDCGACAEACPEHAIYSEFEVPTEWESYIQTNADYYK